MNDPRPFVLGGCLGLVLAPVACAEEAQEARRLQQLDWPATHAAPLAQVEPQAQVQTVPQPDDGEELDEVTVFGSGGYRRKNATSGTKTDTPLLLTPQSIQVIPRLHPLEKQCCCLFCLRCRSWSNRLGLSRLTPSVIDII
ncbi:ferrichrome-iron receptor [Gloeobacter violaceus]|uniref:Gll0339 protein n=1 Tax=Gloeobacter violaceus (strain ATCC 29082 / PCC 7421) TaxID=251221 RepID=Q7NNS1_GLOVI|nr:ferrichrome-iron receptor [Gloeobacter violaceus]BAC88280.1 gll0339 [Gloeobacter violaceus PCC 7421]